MLKHSSWIYSYLSIQSHPKISEYKNLVNKWQVTPFNLAAITIFSGYK